MLDTHPPHPNQESNENKKAGKFVLFNVFLFIIFFREKNKEEVGDDDSVESRGGYERIKSEKRDKRSRLLGSGESDRT